MTVSPSRLQQIVKELGSITIKNMPAPDTGHQSVLFDGNLFEVCMWRTVIATHVDLKTQKKLVAAYITPKVAE
jgi:hypothetical protein